jgi:hypothetical protein
MNTAWLYDASPPWPASEKRQAWVDHRGVPALQAGHVGSIPIARSDVMSQEIEDKCDVEGLLSRLDSWEPSRS